MSAPAASVICPAYDAAGTVAATIRSVLAQTHEDLELIVVDDGSSDKTAQIVADLAQADSRIELIRQSNAGTAGARNRGLAVARGRTISIIDNDDLWMPRYLERVRDALADAPDAGLCHTDAWILDDRTGLVHRQTAAELPARRPDLIDGTTLRDELLAGNFIVASSVTMTRPALDLVKSFDTSSEFKGADDWDLWLRIAESGFGLVRPPGVLSVYRMRPDSVSRDPLLMAKSTNAVARAAVDRAASTEQAQAAASEVIDRTDRDVSKMTQPNLYRRGRTRVRRALGATRRKARQNRDWLPPPPPVRELLRNVEPSRPEV